MQLIIERGHFAIDSMLSVQHSNASGPDIPASPANGESADYTLPVINAP
jgi:hypothetical protein